MDMDEFMELVYETFADEPDNVLANGIIEAADAYVEHEKAKLYKEGTPSDLISRQAARHALCKAVHKGEHKGEDIPCENQTASCLWTGTRVCDFVREIDALPTVQPEPKWIPVSERLPEPRIDVWVNSDLGQMVGYYDEMVELWYGRDYLELIVNAWMPLPTPYTK